MTNIIKAMSEVGIVPVIRTDDQMTAFKAIELLVEEGLCVVEVTLTTPGAIEIIGDISKNNDVLVGAGTVLSIEEIKQVCDVSASFVLSPANFPGFVDTCHANGVAALPETSTLSEVMQAENEGADVIKIFSALQAGGPSYIKALKSVFPNVSLMSTGGITPETIPYYLCAGAISIGLGEGLVDESLLKTGRSLKFRARTREILKNRRRFCNKNAGGVSRASS